jgi:hypothetical protein
MKNEILYRGFENIPSRKGRGGTYQYVRWQDVADRMNEAFGTSWSSEVMFQDVIGGNVIVRVRVCIFDADTKTFTSQEGFGGAPNEERAEAGNPFKAAYSKALKDACKKWGLGLYLEEEGEGNTDFTPGVIPEGYQGKEYGTPPSPAGEPKPAPPVATSGDLPTPPGMDMEMPSGVEMSPPVQEKKPEPAPQVQIPPQANSVPPVPPTAPPAGKTVSLKEDMPMSKVSTISTGEPEKISDVQKAALRSILNMKGVEYESLVKEAFEVNGIAFEANSSIPEVDDLTYQEAVYVVKYGNDKFRKR